MVIVGIFVMPLGSRNLEWRLYQVARKFDMYNRRDAALYDGQTQKSHVNIARQNSDAR